MIVSRDRFHNALQAIKPALGGKYLPVLGYIRLQSSRCALILSATDAEASMSVTIPIEEGPDWVGLIPGKDRCSIVKGIPKGSIPTLEVEGNQLWIRDKGSVTSLPVKDPKDFPLLPQRPAGGIHWAKLDPRGAIARSKDATKPTLSGVLLHLGHGKARVVSTDGFQLAVAETDGYQGPETRIIIPASVLPMIPEGAGLVWDDSRFYWTAPGLEGSVRRITGNYPSYEKVLPKPGEHFVVMDRKALHAALKAVSIKRDEYNRNVRLYFDFPDLRVEFTHPDKGTATACLGFGGEAVPFNLAFNIDYLLRLCSTLKGEEVRYSFKDEISQGDWTDPSDPGFRLVLMPVRYAK